MKKKHHLVQLTVQQNVETNIRKIFLNVIKKHFPPHHKFHKSFNKSKVKISCCCTRNIKTIINSHNAKIFFPKKVLNKEDVISETKLIIH